MIRELRRQQAMEIPERYTITSIYQKFLEISSVEDRIYSGRLSIIADEEALNRELQTSVRKISREMNISKDRAHRIIGFKPYTMHCTQQFYDGFMC